MNYMDFDPYLIRQRNQEILQEVHSLRLEDQLRANARPRGSRLVALAKSGVVPLLQRVRLAG